MKRLISVALTVVLCISLAVFASAADNSGRLYDGADLLTASEEERILSRLDEVSEKYGADVVIVTVDSIGYQSPGGAANYFYDEMGLDYNGILLLISMEERDWYILESGLCNDAITSSQRDEIGEKMVDDLSEGDYADAFETYINECEYYINGHINGFSFEWGPTLLISLVIGLVAALTVTSVMKAQLKSVRANDTATEYVRQGSMNVRVSRDIFLYRHISRTKKPESDSSGSRSGGGRSGGGGKF